MKPLAKCIEREAALVDKFRRLGVEDLQHEESVLHHLRRLAAVDQFTTRHLLKAAEVGLRHMRGRNDPASLLATNAITDLRAFLAAAPAASEERTCEHCLRPVDECDCSDADTSPEIGAKG